MGGVQPGWLTASLLLGLQGPRPPCLAPSPPSGLLGPPGASAPGLGWGPLVLFLWRTELRPHGAQAHPCPPPPVQLALGATVPLPKPARYQTTRGPAPSLPGSTTVGRPVLTAPTFLNPQLHTPIYYSPLKFIICGSLQLLCYSVQFSHSVVSDTLRPHRLQHARLPCPSLSPGACSNSCPLSQ